MMQGRRHLPPTPKKRGRRGLTALEVLQAKSACCRGEGEMGGAQTSVRATKGVREVRSRPTGPVVVLRHGGQEYQGGRE